MFDIGIIGAGPAGYTAAIRASQRGLSVVLFEKNLIGGTCLNKGCIPTKTILHSCEILSEVKNATKYGIQADNINFDFSLIQQRQKTVSEKIRKSLTNLIKGYGIEIVEGEAIIETANKIVANDVLYDVKNIIIATGSKPNIIKFNGNYPSDFILTSDDILNINELPESILIVGSGAIGIEWARILSCLGVKITIVEMMDKLIPTADFEVSQRIERIFKRSRIDFYTSATIDEIQGNNIKLSNGKEIQVSKILLGAGRQCELCKINKSEKLNTNKYINTDNNFKTNIENIYAIGDVNGKSMLAHSAMRQAEDVIEYILDKTTSSFNKNLVPAVIYGSPEIAFIGKTEQQLQDENIKYKKSTFPIAALGKAYADDNIDGFIKILANDKKILGAHIVSPEASAMIQQIAIAMGNNISPKDLSNVIYAHPTYSEGVLESMLNLNNIAIHIPQSNQSL